MPRIVPSDVVRVLMRLFPEMLTLNLSEFVEDRRWCLETRVGLDEALAFSGDWLDNDADMRSVSASIDALQTARN
jgi:hypothetical protein